MEGKMSCIVVSSINSPLFFITLIYHHYKHVFEMIWLLQGSRGGSITPVCSVIKEYASTLLCRA